MNQSKEMAKLAYAALSDKKGEDIQIIDISGVSVLADYFLIVRTDSSTIWRESGKMDIMCLLKILKHKQ